MKHPDYPAEAAHLDGTVQAMLRQIDTWEDRDRNTGADLETSLTLADNAGEMAAVLSPHVHEPYFGRLQVTVGGRAQTLYVGKHAFRDQKGPHHVVSWESDVGGLFYQQATTWTGRTGLSGVVRHKRQLDVRQKALLGVQDLYDDAGGGETGEREAVLLTRLSEAATTGMRDVVQTLQPEQHDAVRLSAGVHAVIQGAAGSGKTTIGFHRLAWLIHPERGEQRARPGHCLVLMPNLVLAAYSRQVLPGLGLDAVPVTTPERWALGLLGLEKMALEDRTLSLLLVDKDKARRTAGWLKAKALGSVHLEEVIRRHLLSRMLASAERTHIEARGEVKGRTVNYQLDTPTLQSLIRQVVRADPVEGYRVALTEALHAHFAAQSGQDPHGLQARKSWQDLIVRAVRAVFLGLVPVGETRKLLADQGRLAELGAGLLSARQLKALASDPLAAIPRSRQGGVDVTELPAILTCHALLSGIGRKDGRDLEPYDHIVIDEAQDSAPLLFRMLARASRPGHVTALGDLSQGIFGYRGPDSWDQLQGALGGGVISTLTRTYRSTREITELGARVAATYSRTAPVVGVDRSGAAVRRSEHQGTAGLAGEVRALLGAGHRNVALVTRSTGEAERLSSELRHHDVDAQPITNEGHRYVGGVVILPVHLAKGLEFDACVAVHADHAQYDPAVEYERRLLYVAVSRGLHALSLHADGALHELLRAAPDVAPPDRHPGLTI